MDEGQPVAPGFEQRLDQIGRATVAIAAERSLPVLLQRIVDAAREVTGAQYGALGVTGESAQSDELVEFITSGLSEAARQLIGPLPRGHGLLGIILRGTTAVRVPRIDQDPRSSGFPPHHPAMTSFLGAPILLRGRNLGNLYLTNKQGAAEFSVEDERLLQILAAHAALALDSVLLHEQTNEAHGRRLRELAAANAQLQRLTSLSIDAQEEERRRISRELHDDTAQALTAVLLRLRLLTRLEGSEEVRAGLIDALDQTAAALDGVRRMAIDLRPSTLDDLGLLPAVESYAREFGERTGTSVRVHAPRERNRRLPRDRELIVYRVVQEALSNVAKHARATSVEIDLQIEGEHLVATVRDDGEGFNVAETLASRERGLGLFGMQERAQLAGGYLDLTSEPSAGTVITLVVPFSGDGVRE